MLRRHPRVQMASVKEVHFFDDDGVNWFEPSYDALHNCFDWDAPNVLRGEATPIYTYWPQAIERLQRYNPQAKIIVGLRHPAHRAFSHWRMETSRGAETMEFSNAIREGRQRVGATSNGVHRVYSYVERGFYAAQLQRLSDHFKRAQLHYFRTDALWNRPAETLGDIEHFLGVDRLELAGREYIVPVAASDLGAMQREDFQYLNALYRYDIVTASRLSGCDLTDWEDADYREPMVRL